MELIDFDIKKYGHIFCMYCTRKDPKVSANLFGNPPNSIYEHRKWLYSQEGKRKIFIIRAFETYVGYCHIYNITINKLEVGWAIHPLFHGKGIGRFSVRELLKKCNELYPNHDVELFVKSSNFPAIKIYEDNGFYVMESTINCDTLITRMKLKKS